MKSTDRSSGRKCAYSILARVLAEKLIEDGILNKPIAHIQRDNGSDIILAFERADFFYRVGKRWFNEHPDNEPLWTPSFVDQEIWRKAAKAFQPRHSLTFNVELHLLPEMKEYVSSLTNAELVPLVRDYLMEFGVLNCPIRQTHGSTYYFNNDEIYMIDRDSVLFPYEGRIKFHLFQIRDAAFNMNVWIKATTQFKPGMALVDCIQIFLDTDLKPTSATTLPFIDRLIQRIYPPEYERIPENTNAATFDRIRVLVGLPSTMFRTWDELQIAVKENRREIDRRVIKKIENDKQFQKFHIPLNFLKLSTVLLRKDYSLEYIFELKDLEPHQTT